MKPYFNYIKQIYLYLLHQLKKLHPLKLDKLPPQLTKLNARRSPYRVDIGRPERVVILLVGCGGTGSHCAHILGQLGSWAKSAGIDIRLYFVDYDKVEEKI